MVGELRAHRARKGAAIAALCMLQCALWSAPAAAAQPTLEEARALFEQALLDEDNGRCEQALQKLELVQSLRDTAPVRFRIASCVEALGRRAKARSLYLSVADGTHVPSAADDEVRQAGREAATRLARSVGYVRLKGAATRGDERVVALGTEPWTGAGMRELDPGAHQVWVQRDDGRRRAVAVEVNAQQTAVVDPFEEEEPTWTERAPQQGAGPWPWIALGVSGAALATGAILFAVRESEIGQVEALRERECASGVCPGWLRGEIDEHVSSARNVTAPAILLVGAGLAGAAASVTWGLLDRRSNSPRRKTELALAPSAHGLQFVAGGSF